MDKKSGASIRAYNKFCKELKAGNILYNLNPLNLWGDYLLVAHVAHVKFGDTDTYTALLIGVKKEDGKYIPRNLYISLTPDKMEHVPFLKYVGYAKFTLLPVFGNIDVNVGLVTVYSQTDLHKFASELSIRKPRTHKYGKDGKLVIKKTNN